MAKLQASVMCGQVAAYVAHHRACATCVALQLFKDRRTRRLQTLFGTVEVEAPRSKVFRCRQPIPLAAVTVLPVCAMLTARCTPELEPVQAELGARTSFRDAAGLLGTLLSALPANQESLRTRTHAVALQLEVVDRQAAAEVTAVPPKPDKGAAVDASRPVVMLDGTYIRAVPGHSGYQVRNFEAICAKIEHKGHPARRFDVVRSAAGPGLAGGRRSHCDQRWRPGAAGLGALGHGRPGGSDPGLVSSLHASSPCRAGLGGLCALEPPPSALPDQAQIDADRLRHLLWNGRHDKECEAVGRITSWAKDAIVLAEPGIEEKARRLVARCTEL